MENTKVLSKLEKKRKVARLAYFLELGKNTPNVIIKSKQVKPIKSVAAANRAKKNRNRLDRHRYANDELHRLAKNLRSMNWFCAVKCRGDGLNVFRPRLGCTAAEFREYIESLFKSTFTWANHGTKWELDHIFPLSLAKTVEELYQLNHYTNIRPLLKSRNRSKCAKMPRKSNKASQADII
jgi:hypothetical protein